MTGHDDVSLRDRDPLWDNAKAILVTLVVVGHTVQPAAAAGQGLADVLYRWIYLFHMPGFVLVAGYLCAELTRRRAGGLVVGLLVPYLIFQTAQGLERGAIGDGSPNLARLLEPRWTLWFLVAMVLWRLSAPLWLAMRPVVVLLAAVGLSILGGVGHGVGHALALDDTLAYLPFFVGGLLLRERAWRPSTALASRAFAIGALLAAGVAVVVTRGSYSSAVHQLSFSVSAVHTDNLRGSALRLALLGAGALLTWAVLVLTPRGAHAWTAVGRWSLYVYLLHALVLVPFRAGDDLGRVGTLGTAVVVVLAILLALVLASRPVRALTAWAVEPVWSRRLLVRGERAPAMGRSAPAP